MLLHRRLQNGHVSSTMPRNHVADERPFVAVKRAHEQHRKYLEQVSNASLFPEQLHILYKYIQYTPYLFHLHKD